MLLLRRLAYPTVLFGCLGLALLGQQRWPEHLSAWSGACTGLGVGLVLLLQAALPFREPRTRWLRDLRLDGAHLVVSNGLTQGLFTFLALEGVMAAQAGLQQWVGAPLWPAQLPVLAQLALAVVLADLGFYLGHRALHKGAWLWKVHSIHHSSDHLHAFSAVRTHPVNALLLYCAQVLPLMLLGAGEGVMALLTVFIGVNGWLQHADIDLDTAWLDGVLATASVHRYHHSQRRDEELTNFSSNTVLWDRLLGSWLRPGPERHPERTGLEGDPIPRRYLAHLLAPFAWERVTGGGEGQEG